MAEDEMQRYRATIVKLTNALRFYANPSNYDEDLAPITWHYTMDPRFVGYDWDGGDIACEALGIDGDDIKTPVPPRTIVRCPNCDDENAFVLYEGKVYGLAGHYCECHFEVEGHEKLFEAMHAQACIALSVDGSA